nr:hypothetical protein [Mycobacterium uberis]
MATPYGIETQDSHSGPMIVGTVKNSRYHLREKILRLAVHHLKIVESEVELYYSSTSVRSHLSKAVTFSLLAYQVT